MSKRVALRQRPAHPSPHAIEPNRDSVLIEAQDAREEGLPLLSCPNMEPGRRIELLSPDYKAGALPLSYPGRLDLVRCN
jgi:hypothetical protein